MKKEQCYFSQHGIKAIDYKDVDLLRKFVNPHARILGKSSTGICAKHQRQLSTAIKRARYMGLIEYIAR